MYAGNKLEVLEKLSRFAAMKIRVEAELIRRKVLEREDLTTFGIGRGIALPHAAVPGISQPIGIFARLSGQSISGLLTGDAQIWFFSCSSRMKISGCSCACFPARLDGCATARS